MAGLKRIIICFFCGLIALPGMLSAARADAGTEYWTLKDDYYYHYNMHCGGVQNMVPISEEAALAFAKYGCPVCLQEDAGSEIQAVSRGRTIVVRFPDAWLAEQELTGVFGWSSDTVHTGEAAHDRLSELLHGDAYNAFLADYMADDYAEGRSCSPYILSDENELIMSSRHIGGSWYIIVRPEGRFGSTWTMYWRVQSQMLRMEDGALSENFDLQTVEERRKISVSSMDDVQAVCERSDDALSISVFRALEGNVAVITEFNADEDFLDDVQLRIGGREDGVDVQGYMNGRDAVYCCMLTDAELAAIQEGSRLSLYREPLQNSARFGDTPYDAVRRGTGDVGIIDRDGNFVVEPVYSRIERPEADSFRVTEPRPFFCYDKKGGLTVLHGETLDVICSFSLKKQSGRDYILSEYMNPSLFRMSTEKGSEFRSLADGSLLFEIPYDETGNYTGNISSVDGLYRVLADGLPQRIVIWEGAQADTSAYLADNTGRQIGQTEYRRITPLIWSGDTGVFLTENFNPDQADGSGNFDGSLQSYFEYGRAYNGSAYGPRWRCGLIDQDGNEIAGMNYTCVEVAGDGTISMTNENGETETFRPVKIGN